MVIDSFKKKLPVGAGVITELNEAFAAQVIASMRQLGCVVARTTALERAISIGHPCVKTEARIRITMMECMILQEKALCLAMVRDISHSI